MSDTNLGFTAVNYISCKDHYTEKFEELFKTRAGFIDDCQGFRNMHVLKPNQENSEYLIVSYWDTEEDFVNWTKSESFIKGHRRGFEDIKKAKEAGEEPPMTSSFKTYTIITN